MANTTYSVTLTQTSNAVRGGYQLTCIDGNNAKCGTLTSATGTSIGTNNATGRQYARQSSPKTLSNGAASWTFSWKAPASATGNVAKFYFVSLAANGNGQKTGDNLFIAADTMAFVTAVSAVSTPEATANVKVYPSVATDILNVELNDANSGVVKIINLQGRICATHTLQTGKNSISVASLPGGYYIARVEAEGKTAAKRFVR